MVERWNPVVLFGVLRALVLRLLRMRMHR
jgi:hypothetical protein